MYILEILLYYLYCTFALIALFYYPIKYAIYTKSKNIFFIIKIKNNLKKNKINKYTRKPWFAGVLSVVILLQIIDY